MCWLHHILGFHFIVNVFHLFRVASALATYKILIASKFHFRLSENLYIFCVLICYRCCYNVLKIHFIRAESNIHGAAAENRRKVKVSTLSALYTVI